jgi:hypothetical protein
MRSLRAILPAALAIVTIACAPQGSLNPLCTNEEAVADPALVGVWQMDGDDGYLEIRGRWQSRASGDSHGSGDAPRGVPPEFSTYSILFVKGNDKKVSSFEGRLVHLGDDSFMDITPNETPIDADFKYFPVVRTQDGDAPQFTKLSELFYMALVRSQAEDASAAPGDSCELQIMAAHVFVKLAVEDDHLRAAWLDREWIEDAVHQGRISIDQQQVGDALLLTATPESLRDLVQQFSNDPQAFKEIGEWRRKR